MSQGTDLRQDGVKITLDKERTLSFDMNALCDMEEAYGAIDKAFNELTAGKVKTIRKMLFFALRHEDETLTERGVGSLVPFSAFQAVADKLMLALEKSLPKTEGNEEKNE